MYGGALDNRVVKLPELAALIAPVAAATEAVPVLGEFLGKTDRKCCNNCGMILCNLAFAVV